MDVYKRMVEFPEFAESNDLSHVLGQFVTATIDAPEVFGPSDDLYVVRDLAVIRGHLCGLKIDVPGFGRTKLNNPTPEFHCLVASPTGYRNDLLAS